jgi:hypothetical protein
MDGRGGGWLAGWLHTDVLDIPFCFLYLGHFDLLKHT